MPYPLLGLTQVLHAMKPAFPQLTKEQNRLFLVCLCRLTAYWREAPPQQIALNGSPKASLRALWLAASGRGCTLPAAMHCPLPMLHPGEITRLKASIDRFVSGVPLAHLTGWWHFMGLDFLASPEALIPRPETERLGARSRALLKQILQRRGGATIFEPCTGSGNLAIALAHSAPNCRVHAIDLSSDALNLARQNAALHNVSERVEFHAGDLFAPLENLSPLNARADLVVCNPPYISSPKVDARSGEILKFGPRMAFDG